MVSRFRERSLKALFSFMTSLRDLMVESPARGSRARPQRPLRGREARRRSYGNATKRLGAADPTRGRSDAGLSSSREGLDTAGSRRDRAAGGRARFGLIVRGRCFAAMAPNVLLLRR